MKDDMISRRAAIDCVNHIRFGMEKMAFDIVTNALLELPPAQPEIIRCNSCRHDNNCAIQDIAQTGGKFFCGFARRKGEQ